ncbi:uncharacterized protein F5147DRAFT_779792 [Suillus discolor]|uniref:Uncharacterized protein n=1 Tax=Suillus discolor TaxID=1912936 RepID=A0A9P7JNM1_9AGAM|nr:uncharacterized protein F5147DRAFT_779792 [Suillus discolor]KAG2092165.1 hypothetical protein F5147DRAFT_779792 [Suillus discolor]
MSSSAVLSNVKMLQDVIFIEIDGVESAWDTYCFALDIESPRPKVLVFRIKDPAASSSAISEERMSVKEEVIGVKIEDQDVGLSEPSTQCATSPCHLLTRRADNPRDPKDTSEVWGYWVRPFPSSRIPEVQATLERIRNGPQC